MENVKDWCINPPGLEFRPRCPGRDDSVTAGRKKKPWRGARNVNMIWRTCISRRDVVMVQLVDWPIRRAECTNDIDVALFHETSR